MRHKPYLHGLNGPLIHLPKIHFILESSWALLLQLQALSPSNVITLHFSI
ncbi:hypothetical protein RchiOBHm_Chr0c04g0497961 [Rosa chinensis]|uniref:Uncharacterized protein n=1 Tax=Rosa chinensis TaxID=74649 RepID=A0A2P6SQU8_ROSCH|nr:hypothetical protein RchiOBHm_Chr0c04g0497961 [Rosa chinensis]